MGVVPPLFVLLVMEIGRNLEWEQERHAPVRVCGNEDGGASPPASPPEKMN